MPPGTPAAREAASSRRPSQDVQISAVDPHLSDFSDVAKQSASPLLVNSSTLSPMFDSHGVATTQDLHGSLPGPDLQRTKVRS